MRELEDGAEVGETSVKQTVGGGLAGRGAAVAKSRAKPEEIKLP